MIPNPFGFSYSDDIDIQEMEQSIARLKRPQGRIDVVLDTDTFNEVDDQFALAYLLQSEDRLNLKAIYAAPFDNHHSNGPKDGMERSYEEIFRVLAMLKKAGTKNVPTKVQSSFWPARKHRSSRRLQSICAIWLWSIQRKIRSM